MRSLILPILLVLKATLTRTQSTECFQYASLNSSSECACPAPFGSKDCASATCGGSALLPSWGRKLAPGITNGDGTGAGGAGEVSGGAAKGNITDATCGCNDGWGGVGCTVCTSDNACSSAFSAASVYSSFTGTPLGTLDDPLTCQTTPRTYGVGFLSCNVDNPTLHSLFPLPASLSITKFLAPSSAPVPSSFYGDPGNATAIASLWYDGVEQFYCAAEQCAQTLQGDVGSDYTCASLKCTCIPGSTFCGGAGMTYNLTSTINDLSGSLQISCADASGTCGFKQDALVSLFGSSGLSLTGCTSGECVRQSVVDSASSNSATAGTSSSNSLSGGVIAGLAVLGAFVLAALSLLALGLLAQRRARKAVVPGEEEKRRGEGVVLDFEGIGYALPVQGSGWWKRPMEGDEGKVLLDGVGGKVAPGEMLAILGPSGAGKSTLVDIISGKRKSGRTSGRISFYSPYSPNTPVRPHLAYVDQHDILHPTLTPREALLLAARLRLPESVGDAEKRTRVFEVLTQLGLADIADVRIGSGEKRGISGGEMRRVSIGLELVGRPEVLVLDEPTSGLDSVSAAKVVAVLDQLAKDPVHPTTIIASIHQPSSRLYHSFSRILLLSSGRTLYSGPGGSAPAAYFAARGQPCPENYNVADHLLEIASDPSLARKTSSSDAGEKAEVKGEDSASEGGPFGAGPSAVAAEGRVKRAKGAQATALTQFEVLSGREWRTLKRDWTLFFMHMAIAAVVGLFCGGIYWKIGIDISGFQNRIGSLFFLGSLLAFSSLSALHNLVEVRALFLRERSGGYYSPAIWLLVRCVWDIIPLRVLPTILISTIVYWMVGLSHDAARFFKFLLILILYSLALTLFNFILACSFRNGGIAILIASIINLWQMVFAGFFVSLSKIPPVLRWLQWLAPLKYCLEALSVNEVGSGLMISDTLQGVPVNVSAELIMKLLFGFKTNAYYRDVLVLFAFIVGFAAILVTIVFFRLREQR